MNKLEIELKEAKELLAEAIYFIPFVPKGRYDLGEKIIKFLKLREEYKNEKMP